ncbi:uncharacterized protein EI90DRAFT_3033946 [Cantharellus anzutake]|uniref:uncharacterized protein n=1 Tax=Cantharellus anzutake TaxID=1750568 RepID=UPI0019045B14|nr:uncharacterized protein EI90DRAFT_3033946 [Cantharellus anzutake]KAF8341424.1 hypothetical protein EI90DRAFT_3033946 [Cantharellus anzutake]
MVTSQNDGLSQRYGCGQYMLAGCSHTIPMCFLFGYWCLVSWIYLLTSGLVAFHSAVSHFSDSTRKHPRNQLHSMNAPRILEE